jgi:hypothetical protein
MMKKLLLKLIRFYQTAISPHTRPKCKYYPTCSQYTYEAIEVYGALRGSLMGMWRILRCNPWSKGGFDPVPEKRRRLR